MVAHERRENLVGGDRVLDAHLHEPAAVGVHRGLPELLRVHFAETLVTLDALTLLGLVHEPADRLGEGRYLHAFLAARDMGAGSEQIPERRADRGDALILGRPEEARVNALRRRDTVVFAGDQHRGVVGFGRRLPLDLIARSGAIEYPELFLELRAPARHVPGVVERGTVDARQPQHGVQRVLVVVLARALDDRLDLRVIAGEA